MYKTEELIILIKTRSFVWCQAFNLVSGQYQHTNVWNINPIWVITNYSGTIQRSLLDLLVKLFGFTDGSLLKENVTCRQAGMGGFLKDVTNKILYMFSGPVQESNVFMVELYAALHLIKVVAKSRYSRRIVYSI